MYICNEMFYLENQIHICTVLCILRKCFLLHTLFDNCTDKLNNAEQSNDFPHNGSTFIVKATFWSLILVRHQSSDQGL